MARVTIACRRAVMAVGAWRIADRFVACLGGDGEGISNDLDSNLAGARLKSSRQNALRPRGMVILSRDVSRVLRDPQPTADFRALLMRRSHETGVDPREDARWRTWSRLALGEDGPLCH